MHYFLEEDWETPLKHMGRCIRFSSPRACGFRSHPRLVYTKSAVGAESVQISRARIESLLLLIASKKEGIF